jgi:ABC-type phosphate transport system ATPase subunit
MIQKFRRFTWEAAMSDTRQNPALDIRGLNVFYGASHALQGVDLTLPTGVMSVVGRNGMGKTTLCKTIMGLTPGNLRLDVALWKANIESGSGFHFTFRSRICSSGAPALEISYGR